MLGQRTRVSDHLTHHVPTPEGLVPKYMSKQTNRCIKTANKIIHDQQWQVRVEDSNEPSCIRFGTGFE